MVETREEEIYEQLKNLRSFNKDFDNLISEIDTKFKDFISTRNKERSFNPKGPSECKINIKVSAVPLTSEEKHCLLDYLEYKYLFSHSVGGAAFHFRKCIFSTKYQIKSYYYDL